MMRINEKNVAALAIGGSMVDREGWLYKRGEVNKSFQRRWFVLKCNILFYFEKACDKEPIGAIIVEGSSIEMAEDDEQYTFKIVFHGPNNRCYVLGADTQESMEQWMKALACASCEYVKVMVAELQQQLDNDEDTIPKIDGQTTNEPSPVAPPRRHNPFNRSSVATSTPLTNIVTAVQSNLTRISFRELHIGYSRRILSDLNAWRHHQRKLYDSSQHVTPIVNDLISL